MTKFRFRAAGLSLLVVACGSPADVKQSAVGAPHEQPPAKVQLAAEKAPASSDELAAAGKAALGSGGAVKLPGSTGAVSVKPEQLVELPFGPVLITSETVENAAQARYGSLGIHYLRRERSGFRLMRSWPEAVSGEAGGEPPPTWTVTAKLTRFPVILAETGGGHMGCYWQRAEIVELRPDGPVTVMHDVIGMEVLPNPYGDFARKLRGRIENIRRGRSFDVRITGTARATVHYAFRDGRFKPVNPSALFLDC